MRKPRPLKRPIQNSLPFRIWGGRRRGAGRPPKGKRAGVAHRMRPACSTRHPVHVWTRMRDISTLRTGPCYRVVRRALTEGCLKQGFRVVEFSVMANHIHLICEAQDRLRLTRGLQGLFIRIARQLNKHLARKGKVFSDRYSDRVLKTPTEVRSALVYVLNNARHHAAGKGRRLPCAWIDPCSSGSEFRGWSRLPTSFMRLDEEPPLPAAATWLLSTGWRRAGPIHVSDVPGQCGRR